MEKKRPTQEQINSALWNACDTFRGAFDSSEYKNYILVMLFLKYLSDVWKDKLEALQKEYGDNPEMLQRKLSRERFILQDDCTFEHLHANRGKDNIGELIDTALQTIKDQNHTKLEGVFRNIAFNSEKLGQTKERNIRLKNLLADFAKPELDFRPSLWGQRQDVIGNAYMYLLERFASGAGKKGGEFYTPHEVCELLARLMSPPAGSRIYDPTCGSGSLLIAVAGQVKDANGNPSRDFSLYGQESNGDTWALAKMNMFLHELDGARIEWGDTLNAPRLLEHDTLMKFDVVVANPPFSLDKWGAEQAEADIYNRYWRGIPPKSKGDYAFITHMIESSLGKVGVIVPHGVLFRGGAEGRIRQALIEENLLDAVIGLPSNLFFGAGIPAAIVIFDKNKTTDDVLFIEASREYEDGKKQNRLREQDMQKIENAYRTRKPIDKYAALATPQLLQENDYNLNIPRYVDTYEPEEPIDLPATQQQIDQLKTGLATVELQMQNYLNELGL